jgi:3-dehydroquinate dehydratase type I
LAGERFLEFRLDYLSDPERGIAGMKRFLTRHPDCTILATCRRRQNQGKFTGSIEEQLQILDAAREAGAHAVDLEIESAENCEERLADLRASTYLLLSYHNYGGTPPRLDNVLRRMTRIPAHGYKVVTTARKPSDTSRLLALAKTFPKVPTILLAMGETGFATRVLSPSLGGLYTYAAPNMAGGTASGQVSAKQLRALFRVGKFSRDAQIYGVIADPVSHSISPTVHNRAFQARRIDASYLPFLVHPGQLKDFFTMAKDLPLAGFSVTIPHKQKILRYLDHVDLVAKRIGAVNTVWRKVARHQYRCSRSHRPIGTPPALEQIVSAGGGQRWGGAWSGVRFGRGRSQADDHRTQHRPRTGLGSRLWSRTPIPRSGRGARFRRRRTCYAAGNDNAAGQMLLSRQNPRQVGLRHGLQPSGDRTAETRPRAASRGDSGAGDVHRAGLAPVRDLDRSTGSARCDGTGRARGPHVKTAAGA